MALSNSTGLGSDVGGDTDVVAGCDWLSRMGRGSDNLLDCSGGPDGEAMLSGEVTASFGAGPASATADEEALTTELPVLLPGPGET